MANLLDYMKWRGDLTLKQVPFGVLDGLVMSQIVFHDLDLVENYTTLSLCGLEKRFFEIKDRATYRLGLYFPETMTDILTFAAASTRFGDICLLDMTHLRDEEKKIQFDAATMLLPDKSIYVAYRGTDDTLFGWYESLAFGVFDEQDCHKLAVAYLADKMKRYPMKKFRVGGHSKGGHLALCAAIRQEKRYRKRLLAVHCFDGPGFRISPVETEGYHELNDRIVSVTPCMSVVGSMLNYRDRYHVVDSEGEGVFQHDVFNWQILGNDFCYLERRSEESYRLEKSLKGWLDKIDDDHKLKFLDALYRLLTASGAKTLSEISEDKLNSAIAFGKTLLSFDKETREVVSRAVMLLLKERKATLKAQKEEAQNAKKAAKKAKKDSEPDGATES